MSLGRATGIALGKFRGAGIASSWDQSRLCGGSDVCAGAGGTGRTWMGRDGKKRFYRKGIVNKDPEARRHKESRARQGLWVE